MMRIALVQMSSQNRLDANLERMRAWLDEAVEKGARVVAFPEMAYYMGSAEEWKPLLAKYDELVETFSGWAREHGVTLIPGTLREPVAGSPGRFHNTLVVLDPKGREAAKYRKLFLFNATLDRAYDESRHCEPGDRVAICPVDGVTLGLGICFDLRFPELFRALKRRGAQVVVLPSAFTVPTGAAHWEILLRARAIENQCFVVAPAQTGKVGEGKQTYGNSLAVSPWGEILVGLGTAEGIAVVDVDLEKIAEAERRVSAWPSPREDVLPIA